MQLAAPAPAPYVAAAPPPVAAPPPSASALAAGLTLKGVFATAAVMALPAGGERIVPIGREVLPGLTLKKVGVAHALLHADGGDVMLELGKVGPQAVTAPPPALAPAEAGETARQREETLAYRFALEPVGGRGGGYRVKPGQPLPHLARAGLRPGDVILGVNGSGLDEERLMELSWQIANSSHVDFEVSRAGKKMKLSLQREQ